VYIFICVCDCANTNVGVCVDETYLFHGLYLLFSLINLNFFHILYLQMDDVDNEHSMYPKKTI
jgi:hypothetical protein